MNSWFTKKQIANYLSLTPRSINNYVAGGMPHVRLPSGHLRFNTDDVDAWLRQISPDPYGAKDLLDEILEGLTGG